MRSRRAYVTTAAATGITSQGTRRAHDRWRMRLSTNVLARPAATIAMTTNATTAPTNVYSMADRTAAVSSSDAGPKNRTAANASKPPTTIPVATAPAVPRATRKPSDHGDSPFNSRRRNSRCRSRVTSAVAEPRSASDDSNPTSRTGAMVPATTAVDAPACRTTAFNGSPSIRLRFLIDSSTSTVCRATSAIVLNRSARTAASCRLMPSGSGRTSHSMTLNASASRMSSDVVSNTGVGGSAGSLLAERKNARSPHQYDDSGRVGTSG